MVTVLVTGVGGDVAQGIVKALKMSPIDIRIIGTDCNPRAVGLHMVDTGYVVCSASEDSFYQQLNEITLNHDVSLIFIGSDAESQIISQRVDWVERAKVLCGEPHRVANCDDKYGTSVLLERHKIAHPDTMRGDMFDPNSPAAKRKIIIKPRWSCGSKDIKVFDLRTRKGFRTCIEHISNRGMRDYVVQQYIGEDKEEYTAATYLDADRNVSGIVMRRELMDGTSYRVERVVNDKLLDCVTTWAFDMDMYGTCNWQFRLHEDVPTIFEINYRYSGTTGIRAAFGFNDAEMAIREHIYGEYIFQPELRRGVALRYWSEVIIPNTSFKELEETYDK